MFGGLTFLTHGRLTEPVVRPFAMTGRSMREIIVMAADALAAGVGCPLQH